MHLTPYLLALFFLTACTSEPPALVGAGENWDAYLGHPSSNQYSFLDQITKENVGQLEVAWVYETGDSSQYQSNNLIIDGILYTATPTRKLTALNAATGEALWTFDPNDVHGRDKTVGRNEG